jgi:hypothetical protein
MFDISRQVAEYFVHGAVADVHAVWHLSGELPAVLGVDYRATEGGDHAEQVDISGVAGETEATGSAADGVHETRLPQDGQEL